MISVHILSAYRCLEIDFAYVNINAIFTVFWLAAA